MPCYHPLKRFVTGTRIGKDGRVVDTATYRPAFMCDRYSSDPLRKREVYALAWLDSRPGPYLVFDPDVVDGSRDDVSVGQLIRCGRCLGCMVDKSREWANRLLLEKEYYPDDQCWFVTLTYDEDHVPRSFYPDPDTGEAQPCMTLDKKHLQDFMKRLRKNSRQKIRFFGCGEYGPQTMRPHYHLILFGLSLGDLVPYGKGEAGFMYYQSNWLSAHWATRLKEEGEGFPTIFDTSDTWSNFYEPWGRVLVSPASWQTFAYVARYTTKKLYGEEASHYERFNIVPPFLQMSLKPGIGARWFQDHPDVYGFEYINVKTPTGGKKFRPPHYFDVLFDREDPEGFEKYKASRSAMLEAQKEVKLSRTSLLYSELLEVEEREFKSRIKKLKREVL